MKAMGLESGETKPEGEATQPTSPLEEAKEAAPKKWTNLNAFVKTLD